MSDRTSSWLPRIVLVLILAAALGLRLQKAWASTSELLTHTTTDDAYYYFEIARNIVDGNHVTFDGEHVTNGFHPLWLVMVLPIFVIDDRLLAVHLALTLGALLGVATVALLYATVRRLIASEPAALLAAGAYAVHPAAVQDSVAGVESAASAFTLSVALLLFINLMDDTGAGRRGGRFRWGWFGLACGAVILARTDSFLLVIAMYAALALMVCRAGRPRDERPLLGVRARDDRAGRHAVARLELARDGIDRAGECARRAAADPSGVHPRTRRRDPAEAQAWCGSDG